MTNDNSLICRNIIDTCRIEAGSMSGYGPENLLDAALYSRWRSDGVSGVVVDIAMNESRAVNFVSIIDHNMMPGDGFQVEYLGPYVQADTLFEYPSAWYVNGDVSWLPGGGVEALDSVELNIRPEFYNQAYVGYGQLRAGVNYHMRVDVDVASYERVQFATPEGLRLDGVPVGPFVELSLGVNEWTLTVDADRGFEGVTLSMTTGGVVSRWEIYEDVVVWDSGVIPAVLPIYPYGSQPWGGFAGDGRVSIRERNEFSLICHSHGPTRVVSHVRITFSGAGNPLGYIEAGRICVGSAFQPLHGMDTSWKVRIKDMSKRTRNRLTGEISINRGGRYRVMDVKFSNLGGGEFYALMDMFERTGESRDVVFIGFPSSDSEQGRVSVYGVLSDPGGDQSDYENYNVDIKIEEIGGVLR